MTDRPRPAVCVLCSWLRRAATVEERDRLQVEHRTSEAHRLAAAAKARRIRERSGS
jgi:hypothetical protein